MKKNYSSSSGFLIAQRRWFAGTNQQGNFAAVFLKHRCTTTLNGVQVRRQMTIGKMALLALLFLSVERIKQDIPCW